MRVRLGAVAEEELKPDTRRAWCAGASRRWFGLVNSHPKRQSQPRNLIKGGCRFRPFGNSPDRCCDGRNLQGDPMAALDTVLAKIDANLDLLWHGSSSSLKSLR